MKSNSVILSCLLIFCISSCKQDSVKETTTIKLKVESVISELSDNSFFADIRCMLIDEDKLYFSDYKRGDIVILNKDLTLFSTIGRKGSGPGEIEAPSSFIKSDNHIYVVDDLNRKIVEYKNKEYMKELKPECIYSRFNNFIKKDSCLYFPVTGDSHSIVKYDMHKQTMEAMGNFFEFGTPAQSIVRNHRFLLINENYLYAISDNLPVIEKYDLKNKSLIYKYDFSDISIIKATVRFTKSQTLGEYSYFSIVQSVYLANNKIYVLCNKSEREKDFSCNNILEFEEDRDGNLQINKIYQLPDIAYTSFCVDPDNCKIYSYNNQNASIEKLDMQLHF